jgi:predicted histone-like DNA-binding protein
MNVKFSVYATPKPNDREGETFSHARIQPKGTKRIGDICEYIKNVSSLSPADIKGALEALFDYIALELTNGYNVELENFGHFSIALCSRQKTNGKGKKQMHITVEGVNFRCSPRFKKEVQKAKLTKIKKELPLFPSIEEREKRMIAYLEKESSINVSQYAGLNACTRYCAGNDIRAFLGKGIIIPSGITTHRVYLLANKEEKKPAQ